MCLKEMKRQLKAKVMYFDKSDKSIWEIKLKPLKRTSLTTITDLSITLSECMKKKATKPLQRCSCSLP